MKHTNILILLCVIFVYSSSCTVTDNQHISKPRSDIIERSVSMTTKNIDIKTLDEVNKKGIDIPELKEGVYIGELTFDKVTFISRVVIDNGRIVEIDIYSEKGKMITTEYEGLINEVISKQSFTTKIAEKNIRDRMILAAIKKTLLEGDCSGTIGNGIITKPAALIYKHIPKYPRELIKQNKMGLVVLQVVVGKDGKPRAVDLQKSSGHIELDKLAIEAAGHCVFDPALNNGEVVEMGVLLYYNFLLKSKYKP